MDAPQVTRQWPEVRHEAGEDLGQDRIRVRRQQRLFETEKENR